MVTIEATTATGLRQTSELHRRYLSSGIFPRMGLRFLSRYHETFVASPGGVALSARHDGEFVGFLLGTVDNAAHYRWVVNERGMVLARSGVAALLLRPHVAWSFATTRLGRYLRGLRRLSRPDRMHEPRSVEGGPGGGPNWPSSRTSLPPMVPASVEWGANWSKRSSCGRGRVARRKPDSSPPATARPSRSTPGWVGSRSPTGMLVTAARFASIGWCSPRLKPRELATTIDGCAPGRRAAARRLRGPRKSRRRGVRPPVTATAARPPQRAMPRVLTARTTRHPACLRLPSRLNSPRCPKRRCIPTRSGWPPASLRP